MFICTSFFSKFIFYMFYISMQITPFKINNFPVFKNVNRNVQYPRFNSGLQRDTVCFTSSNTEKNYEDILYKSWDERMTDTYGFGIPITRFHCLPGYIEVLKKFDVKDFIRLGGESAVFELKDGNILKLSTEKYPPYLPEYYAPELDRGVVKLSQEYTARNNKPSQRFDTDEIYYLIQRKGVPLTDAAKALSVFNKAENEGLKTADFAASQFAYFDTPNGKEVKCIDMGCIMPKTYPISRDFEAIERMSPQDTCKPYGMAYFTIKKYFPDLFKNDDEVNSYLQSIKPRIDSGESIFDVINEKLVKSEKPIIEHIK